jgi:hypothetical protein
VAAYRCRAFHKPRRISSTAIICLYSFTYSKLTQKSIPKDGKIVPNSWLIRAIYPDKITSEDTNSYFIPKSRTKLVLVRVELAARERDLKIRTINGD